MESTTLSHNNVHFTAEGDSETSNKLINDTYYASRYASDVYKASLTNENTKEEQAESNFIWTQNLTQLLLDIRKREEPNFNRPNSDEKQLWQNIADEINNVINVGVTGDICDIKYRELSATYRDNQEKNSIENSNTLWRDEVLDTVLDTVIDAVDYKVLSAPFTSMLGNKSEESEDRLSTSFIDHLSTSMSHLSTTSIDLFLCCICGSCNSCDDCDPCNDCDPCTD